MILGVKISAKQILDGWNRPIIKENSPIYVQGLP